SKPPASPSESDVTAVAPEGAQELRSTESHDSDPQSRDAIASPSESHTARTTDPVESPAPEEDSAAPESFTDRRRTFTNPRGKKLALGPVIGVGMVAIASFVGWRVYERFNAPAADPTAEEQDAPQPTRRLAVRTVTAERGLAEQWLFDEGIVWPVNRRVLNFQANGDITYVASVNGIPLREGDRVSKGQLLATIDSRRQRSQLTTADADIQVAVNQRRQSEAGRRKAQAAIAQAKSDLALAKTELRRNQELFEAGVVPESEIDVKRNQVVQAEAALASAQQDLNSSLEDLKSSDSQVTAARARLTQEAVDFEDTQLVAPIDGVVAYINIRAGEYWSTQYLDTSSPQRVTETAPIVLMDANSFEAVLEVQSIAAESIRPGQQVYVVLEDDVSTAQASGVQQSGLLRLAQQRGSVGRIFSVSPSQSPGDRGTRVSIRGFQRPDRLKVGGRVYAWVSTASKPSAVMIPIGALIVRDQDRFAFVLNPAEGTVERRQVVTGIEGLAGIEIVSGIEPGEQVVIEGQNRLVDGAPVEVIERGSR
ncbi:MAG: biotin/lipoyl-binding protein, partial [Cyanobacteria bacterium P01_H01_bin.130]